MIKKMGALAFLVILFSCTTYSRAGSGIIGGGYNDFPLGNGRYRVEAYGNGYTSMQRVESIALKRAAELTLEKGHKYFYLIDEAGNTTSTLNSSQYFTYTVNRHSVGLVIQLTDDSGGIDAQEMFDSQRL